MNLLTHETKMKLFNDNKISHNSTSVPKWSQNISDLVRKNHQAKFQLGTIPNEAPSTYSNNRIGLKMPSKINQRDQALRDTQSRMALDDCSNYVQQQNINNIFPSSTQQANPSSFITLGNHNPSGIQSTKQGLPQFKFNLTLNRNKHQPNQKSVENTGTATMHQTAIGFYNKDQALDGPNYGNEDQEAVIIVNERQARQPRGQSALAAHQQSKFKLVKTYDERLNEEEAFEIQDYDLQDFNRKVSQTRGQSKAERQRSIKERFEDNDPMEERQKIFEEEIIKRVKEIQKYAKSLHLQIKKLQSGNAKKTEEWVEIKDQLLKLKEDLGRDEPLQMNEQIINELIMRRVEQSRTETEIMIEDLESKIAKEIENKCARAQKNAQNESIIKMEHLKEEIIAIINEDYIQTLRTEICKQIQDKFKDAQRTSEKGISEIREILDNYTQDLDDMKSQQEQIQRDGINRNEKIQKQLKDERQYLEEQLNQQNESVSDQIEQMKKRIIKDFKSEFDVKQFASQTDLNDQLNKFNAKISALNEQISKNNNSQQYDQVNDAITQLNQQAETLIQRQDDQGNLINSINSKISQLQHQVQNQLNQSNNHGTSDEIQAIRESQEILTEQISNLQTQFDNLQMQIETIQQENQSERGQIQNQVRQIEQQSRNQREEQHNLKDQLLSKIEKQEETINQFKQQNTDKISELRLQNSENLHNLREEVLSEIDSVRDQVNNQAPAQQIDEQIIVQTAVSQLQPQIQTHTNQLQTISENLEYFKSQLSQRTLRSEMQEIKSEIDDQLSKLSKSLKKQDERFVQIDQQLNKMEEFEGEVNDVKYEVEVLKEQLERIQEDNKVMIQKLSTELNQQIQEIRENQMNQPIQMVSENREFDSREFYQYTDTQVNNLKLQISQIKEHQRTEIDSTVKNLTHKQEQLALSVDQLEQIVKETQEKVEQISEVNLDEVNYQIDQINQTLGEQIQELTTQQNQNQEDFQQMLQSQQSKLEIQDRTIHELQERVKHQIENSNQQFQGNSINEEELEQHKALVNNQIDEIRQQIDDLSQELNKKVSKIVQDLSNQQPSSQIKSFELENLKEELQSENQKLSHEIATIKEIISQQKESDVSLKKQFNQTLNEIGELKEDFSQLREDFNSTFDSLGAEVSFTKEEVLKQAKLEKQIQHDLNEVKIKLEQSQNDLSQEVKILQEVQNCLQETSISEAEFSEFKEKVLNQFKQSQSLTEELIQGVANQAQLAKEEIQNEIERINSAIERLETQAQQVPRITIGTVQDKNNIMAPAHEVSVINSCRSQQNFLESANKTQNKNQYQTGVSQNQNYNANFLDDLSEADLSNNGFNQNQADDSEMMMFNNKTQSLGTSSIMSNKLHNLLSPVEARQFHFNQQVAQKLQSNNQDFQTAQTENQQHISQLPYQNTTNENIESPQNELVTQSPEASHQSSIVQQISHLNNEQSLMDQSPININQRSPPMLNSKGDSIQMIDEGEENDFDGQEQANHEDIFDQQSEQCDEDQYQNDAEENPFVGHSQMQEGEYQELQGIDAQEDYYENDQFENQECLQEYEDEDAQVEGEEEEEYITADQATEMVAEWLLGNEVEMSIEKYYQLKQMRFNH